jgi:hypothetical protein
VSSTAKEINLFQTIIKMIAIMKNLTFSIASILPLIIGLSLSLSAQTTATWQGGKPGRTTEWNCAANWSKGRIPDEFTQVIIPAGAQYYPIIKNETTPIDALLMEGGAELTLHNGAILTVLGETGRFDGITIFGKITNNGTLEIGDITGTDRAFLNQIQGDGKIVSNTSSLSKR